MKSIFFRIVLLVGLVIALFAPFTFLVPETRIVQDKLAPVVTDPVIPAPVEKKVKVIEQPLHKVVLPNFADIYDIPTKKRQFFDFIRPAIVAKNKQLASDRAEIETWHEKISLGIGLTAQEQVALEAYVKAYRVNKQGSTLQQLNDLLTRVDIIPTELVLVQAANESAWGTSRFARLGLNFFGIWCYQSGCGIVPSGRKSGAKHEVAAFDSVDDAVAGYFNNINKHNAYHVFRTIRAELRAQNQPLDAEILASGLLPYSERGSDYVLDIKNMLRHNQAYFGSSNT
ncbi:glucosaminidase domain-containing protein [Colwelliaceae bacterium MEBiC 14330]